MTTASGEGAIVASGGDGAPQTERAATDDFFALVLALSSGALVLVLTLLPFLPKGIGEAEEQNVYVLAWPAALLAAVGVPLAFRFAERRWIPEARLFWPLLGLAHTGFWLVWVAYVRMVEVERAAERARDLTRAFRWSAIGHVAMSIALLVGFAAGGRLLPKRRANARSALRRDAPTFTGLCVLLVSAGLASIAVQFSQTAYSVPVLVTFVGVGALLTLVTRPSAPIVRPGRLFGLGDAFVFAALVLLLWFPETLEGLRGSSLSDFAQIWTSHYHFLLGPVEGILQGRSPLVDANSQYGVGIVYFIALVFRLELVDWSTHGLAHLICALEVLRYFFLYAALKRLTRSTLPAMLFLGAGLAINVYAPIWTYFRLPNQGPLRFIVEYTLVVGLAFQPRGKIANLPRGVRLRILGLVALGALWSLDMAVATVGAYLGTRALVAFASNRTLRTRTIAFGRDLAVTAAAIAVAVALLALYVRASAGAWPIWSRAFEYAAFYRTWGNWSAPMDTWAMWLPVGLVYLASVVTIVRRMDPSIEAQTVLAMSLVGIADMNYYVGRSYLENLAAVSLPAVFVCCYWLARVLREATGALRLAGGTAAYAAALMMAFTGIPGFTTKVPASLLFQLAKASTVQPWTHSRESIEAAELMAKYAPTQRRLAVFLSDGAEVEALLMARKTQLWPVGYHEQDNLLPRARRAALEFEAPLAVGDFVFVGPTLTTPAAENSEALTHKYELAEVEKTPFGVRALRITRKL